MSEANAAPPENGDQPRRRLPARNLARAFASAAFLVLVVGSSYFTMLVMDLRFGSDAARVAALREIGLFLSGQLAWYQDATFYGVASLLLALVSLLFGNHRLARITVVVSGVVYLTLLLARDGITDLLLQWAR